MYGVVKVLGRAHIGSRFPGSDYPRQQASTSPHRKRLRRAQYNQAARAYPPEPAAACFPELQRTFFPAQPAPVCVMAAMDMEALISLVFERTLIWD